MNIALWIVQILLAFLFLLTAGMKLLLSKEQLLERGLHAIEGFSPITIRILGLLELLGAVGLILPALTGILPWLTPLAAVGLALMMVGAFFANLKVHEYRPLVLNIVVFVMAVFVAYGRFLIVPL